MMESEGLLVSDDLRDARRQIAILHLQIARMDDERKEQLSNLETHMHRKQSCAERSHQEQTNLLQEDLQVVRNERNRKILELQAKLAIIEKRYADKDGELRKARLEIFQLRVERDEARRYVKGMHVEREGSLTQYNVKPGEVPEDLHTVNSPDEDVNMYPQPPLSTTRPNSSSLAILSNNSQSDTKSDQGGEKCPADLARSEGAPDISVVSFESHYQNDTNAPQLDMQRHFVHPERLRLVNGPVPTPIAVHQVMLPANGSPCTHIARELPPHMPSGEVKPVAGQPQEGPESDQFETVLALPSASLSGITQAASENQSEAFLSLQRLVSGGLASISPPSKGRLHLDARSMVCAGDWRRHNSCSSWTVLVIELLRHGCFFQWRDDTTTSEVPDLHSFPGRSRQTPIPTKDWWSLSSSLPSAYSLSIRDFLSSAPSSFLLSLGGISWRLTLHYEQGSSLAQAASHPSFMSATGDSPTKRVEYVGVPMDKQLLPGDLDVLIGRLPDGRSLWPPPHVFSKSMAWNGSWKNHNEDWFQKRLGELQAEKKVIPYNEVQWRSILVRDLPRDKHRSKSAEGSVGYAIQELGRRPELKEYSVIELGCGSAVYPKRGTSSSRHEDSGWERPAKKLRMGE